MSAVVRVYVRDGVVVSENPTVLEPKYGTRIQMDDDTGVYRLVHDRPGTGSVLFRVGAGILEWSTNLAELAGGFARTDIEAPSLVSLIHGVPIPPDHTHVPGVRRLSLGSTILVDSHGVTVSVATPPQPTPAAGGVDRLERVMSEVLADYDTNAVIGFSGGLASSFLAACAAAAGISTVRVHVSLASPLPQPALPEPPPGWGELVNGGRDLADWVANHHITGTEVIPPLPDAYYPGRALLAVAAGRPVISGALLETLLSTNLADVRLGVGGRRLWGCEPFHTAGVLHGLRAARTALRRDGPETLQAVANAPASTENESGTDLPAVDPVLVPGLTEKAREAWASARLASQVLWREHHDTVGSVYARVERGLRHSARGWLSEEAVEGAAAVLVPALDPRVLAVVATARPDDLGLIEGGRFVNQLPLRATLTRAGVASVRESGTAFRARLMAARCLHRHRRRLIAEIRSGSALADLGLLEPGPAVAALADGAVLAEHALPLLRMIWLDRWLRGPT